MINSFVIYLMVGQTVADRNLCFLIMQTLNHYFFSFRWLFLFFLLIFTGSGYFFLCFGVISFLFFFCFCYLFILDINLLGAFSISSILSRFILVNCFSFFSLSLLFICKHEKNLKLFRSVFFSIQIF